MLSKKGKGVVEGKERLRQQGIKSVQVKGDKGNMGVKVMNDVERDKLRFEGGLTG